MSSLPSEDARDTRVPPVKKRRRYFKFSLATLLAIVTLISAYLAYRTNQQMAKYYTPALVAAYDPQIEPYQFVDDDFVDAWDLRPATVQLDERVSAITRHIAELRSSDEIDRASDVQASLDEILAHREGPYLSEDAAQLHVIGVYEGQSDDDAEEIDKHKVGDVHVKVTYAGAPLVVALCAYDPVHWILHVEPDVQIKRVVVGGHHRQQIDGVPEGVPVEGQFGGSRDDRYRFQAYHQSEAAPLFDQLRELTGLVPLTFSGTYRYEDPPFSIGAEDSEWAAKMTVHALDHLFQAAIRDQRDEIARELVQYSFPEIAVAQASGRHGGYQTSFATHSVFGPYADTMQPIDQPTMQFATDPEGPSFFGWNRQPIVINPETGAVAEMQVEGLDVEHQDIFMGYDRKRHRLLLWGRDLSAVDILSKQATQVCKGRPNVVAFAYSEADDLIYAACTAGHGQSNTVSEICVYNHRGAQLRRVKLVVPLPNQRMKMTFVAGRLVIMALGPDRRRQEQSGVQVNYVVDPETGKLLFACKRQPR